LKDFSSLTRYGLPGWIFAVTLALPHVLSIVFEAKFQSQLASVPPAVVGPIGGLLAFVAIPVGYLLYQLYLVMHWWTGNFRRSHIPQESARGCSFHEDVTDDTLTFHDRWALVDDRWHELLQRTDAPLQRVTWFSQRAEELQDRYHALGASVTAMVVATVLMLVMPSMWEILSQVEVFFWMALLLLLAGWALIRSRQYVEAELVRFRNGMMRLLERELGIIPPEHN
jgi:protein-S-isoprenylcysteine O-methyltransferase Ste14